MIRLGDDPGTTEYLEKSVTPVFRRKSSSSSRQPLTWDVGARIMARIASEKMVFNNQRCNVAIRSLVHLRLFGDQNDLFEGFE